MDVVLFDIDGTLIDTAGAGRRALVRAAHALHQRADLFDGIAFDGATDRAICRAALARVARSAEADIDRLLEVYLELLAEEVGASSDYRALAGAPELVAALGARGVLLGLGTGNVEAGARIKLERAGLNPAFGFGGFGCDAEDRGELLRRGFTRAARSLGHAPRRPWIIGDTPLDLAAGRRVGARVVLVASGRLGVDELRRCEPELCVETLEDERVLALADG